MGWTCSSCGGTNPEGMRFCGHCGAPMTAPQPAPADEREAALTAFASDRIDPTGAGMTEERRLITALFADLSGFTPLSERLDAEELLEVIDPIISALSDIVGRYGGYVEKFAGDALLALFGAPIAHEDDATRALEVAIEMHRALERLRETLGANGEDLTLHIGIASGRGIARMIGSKVRMDYAVLGDSVILAQRLESATPPGETYLSHSTREIVRDRFELEPMQPLTLKGKAEPVPAWRLLGPKRAADQGSGLAGRRRAPLLGRAHEVARLRDAIEALAGGVGAATVGIVGEPGIGKSRLVEEARRIAADRGVAWLDARCLSYGAALPYWPIADLLRRDLGLAGNETTMSDTDVLKALDGLPVPRAAPSSPPSSASRRPPSSTTSSLKPFDAASTMRSGPGSRRAPPTVGSCSRSRTSIGPMRPPSVSSPTLRALQTVTGWRSGRRADRRPRPGSAAKVPRPLRRRCWMPASSMPRPSGNSSTMSSGGHRRRCSGRWSLSARRATHSLPRRSSVR